jgi:hypothetical protein
MEECADADRLFAQQQEQLVAAHETVKQQQQQLQQLHAQLRQQQQQMQHEQQAQQATVHGLHQAEGVGQRSVGSGSAHATAAAKLGGSHNAAEEACDVQLLRLKYLKSKSAVESLTASNTRLLRELDSTRAAAAEAQQQLDALAAGRSLQRGGVGSEQQLAVVQELAAADHRAQRLQIELDAALAELAVHRAGLQQSRLCTQPHLLPEGASRAQVGWPAGQATIPVWQQEDGSQPAVTCSLQTMPRVPGQPHLAPSQCPMLSGNMCFFSDRAAGAEMANLLLAHAGRLPPQQNVLELHLRSAELLPEALDPLPSQSRPLTFLTADFYDASTQLSSVAEGRAFAWACSWGEHWQAILF